MLWNSAWIGGHKRGSCQKKCVFKRQFSAGHWTELIRWKVRSCLGLSVVQITSINGSQLGHRYWYCSRQISRCFPLIRRGKRRMNSSVFYSKSVLLSDTISPEQAMIPYLQPSVIFSWRVLYRELFCQVPTLSGLFFLQFGQSIRGETSLKCI